MSDPEARTPLNNSRIFWAAVLIVGVTLAAYLPALTGGFVWDDDTFLTQNKLIRAGDGLYRFWFTTDATDFWPVTYSSLWIEWRLWGMNPLGYHVVNLVLHLAEVFLLWAILRRLRFPAPYLAAFLFAVHPVNVESVAWIAQRKNLMAMLFYLLSIWFFVGSTALEGGATRPRAASSTQTWRRGDASPRLYLLSLLSFVLAMLSKGSVAVLPLVLLGIVMWRRRIQRADILRLAPFFGVSLVLAATDVWFQRHGFAVAIRDAGFLERLLGAAAAVWFYLYKALLPLNLVFVYPQWHIDTGNPLWWMPLVAGVALTAVLFHCRAAGTRAALYAWAYFCAALVPVMGFTDVYFMKYSLVADHYQHLAIIGVIGFVAAEKSEIGKRKSESFPSHRRIVAGVVICVLAFLTFRQCENYRDSETLYSSILEKNPESWMAQNNLGNVLYASGRVPEAMARYEEAARLKPDFPDAHNNIGMVLAAAGRLPEATTELEEALRLEPHYAEALVNLGNVLQREGRSAEAIADFEQALRWDPDSARAHSDLGIALAETSQLSGAVLQFQEAVRLQPDFADAYSNLGNALTGLGRLPDAIAAYQEALRLKPDAVAAHAGLGTVYADMGRLPEAAAELEKAVRLNPDYAAFHYNLGTILRALGREDEAKAEFDAADRLQNNR